MQVTQLNIFRIRVFLIAQQLKICALQLPKTVETA